MREYTFTKLERPYAKLGSGKVKEVFYNKEMNNLMVFDPHKGSNVDKVLGYTTEEPYDYIMNKLNSEKGIIVEWYKYDHTTSDYNIYYGLDVETIAHKPFYEIKRTLENCVDSNPSSYKFNEVFDGVMVPASFIEVK